MSARRVYPKFNRMGFILPLVIGLVVAVVILGTVVFWQLKPKTQTPNLKPQTQNQSVTQPSRPDLTANWKTYTSKEMGFSVKYPPTWLTENSSTTHICRTDQVFFAPNDTLLGKCGSGFGGIIGIGKSKESFNVDKIVASWGEHNFTNYTQLNTKVAGKTALKFFGISQLEGLAANFKGDKFIVYSIDLNGGVLTITYDQSAETIDYSKELELMVSTFKFLN